MAKVVRTISADASVTATAIDALDIVKRIRKIHNTSAVMTAALGRISIAASLMGMGLKNTGDSLTLMIDGKGPAGKLLAVADGKGNVKVCAGNYGVEIPLNKYGKLDVAGAVGTDGTLSVVKDMGLKAPYCGKIPIATGEIAEDVASYFAISEQIPTVCGLGIVIDTDLTVKAAGGFLVQLLPFADDSVINTLEETVKKLPPVSKMLEEGAASEDMAMKVLEGLSPNVLDSFECGYECDCSRERAERILIGAGMEEMKKMASDTKDTEICCHFCDKKYIFTPKEVFEIMKKWE